MPDEKDNESPLEKPAAARRQESPWAQELKRLKTAAWEASSKRERLPQPMFWSLFHSVISSIRRQKAVKRTLESIFEGQEEEKQGGRK